MDYFALSVIIVILLFLIIIVICRGRSIALQLRREIEIMSLEHQSIVQDVMGIQEV